MPRAPRSTHIATAFAAVAFLLAAGCAPTAPPAVTPSPAAPIAPVASEWTGALQPSAGALRAAETAALTGLELGTMWTFENPPRDYWQRTYGFSPTEEWLEHVRLSSVRYGQHCSASFVSPTGLVMTNHHCALDCIEAVSTEANDYVVDGFYAPGRGQELTCPGLFLDQLVEIEDVTARVHGAAPADAPAAQVAAAQAQARSRIEEDCSAASELTCQVVSLYHGGQYQLYKYQRYAPVKLVWAPDVQAGFYGGDPDNFTYPRYNLDVSFLRAYEADGVTAASTPYYFRWNAEGAGDGELVFITGNPGSTARLATVPQLVYEQRTRHPFVVEFLGAQSQVLHAYAARGPEQEREVRETIFSVNNSLKAFTGQLGGLQDTLLMGRKIRWERSSAPASRPTPRCAPPMATPGTAWRRSPPVATTSTPRSTCTTRTSWARPTSRRPGCWSATSARRPGPRPSGRPPSGASDWSRSGRCSRAPRTRTRTWRWRSWPRAWTWPAAGSPKATRFRYIFPLRGRHGFDVLSEVGAACRGFRHLVKQRKKPTSANDNLALAA
jgi:hypothetical protein